MMFRRFKIKRRKQSKHGHIERGSSVRLVIDPPSITVIDAEHSKEGKVTERRIELEAHAGETLARIYVNEPMALVFELLDAVAAQQRRKEEE